MAVVSTFSNVQRKLGSFLIVMIGTPIILILFFVLLIPVYFYRWIIGKIVPGFNSEIGKMVCATSSILASEWEQLNSKPVMNCCICLKLEGKLDFEKLIQNISEKLVFLKNPNGELMYPELQQYYTKCMGYIFFKWDKKFDLKNHVSYYKDENGSIDSLVNQDKLMEIRKYFTYKAFPPNRSPWEFVVINNFKRVSDMSDTPKFVLIFRLHHGLADGFSIIKAFQNGLATLNAQTVENVDARGNVLKNKGDTSESSCGNILKSIGNFFVAPYQFVEYIQENKDGWNSWHLPIEKLSKTRTQAESDVISVDSIKKVKNHFKVHYNSVLYAAIGGGIRNYSLANQIECPPFLHMYVPVVRKNHPSKLRNHITGCMFRVPLLNGDPVERLITTEEYLIKGITSAVPVTLYKIAILVGSLPVNWIKNASSSACSLLLSSLPGPSAELSYDQNRVLEMGFSGGLGRTSIGLAFSAVSYNGGFNFHIGADHSILKTKKELTDLLNCICRELDTYLRLAEV